MNAEAVEETESNGRKAFIICHYCSGGKKKPKNSPAVLSSGLHEFEIAAKSINDVASSFLSFITAFKPQE